MTEIVVKAVPERLPLKKSMWPRLKPIRVHYSVAIDGKEKVAFKRDYEPVKIAGAITSTKEFLVTWARQLVEFERAVADFNSLKIEETVTV